MARIKGFLAVAAIIVLVAAASVAVWFETARVFEKSEAPAVRAVTAKKLEAFSGDGDFSDGAELLTQSQREIILEHLELYYRSLSTLSLDEKALSELFSDERSLALNSAMWRTVCSVRDMAEQNLSVASYSFSLRVISVESDESGDIEVELAEDSAVNFAAYRDTDSMMWNDDHHYTLTEVGGSWKIKSYSDGSAMYDLLTEPSSDLSELSESDYSEYLAALSDDILAEAASALSSLSLERASDTEPPTFDSAYDRAAAVTYSETWSNGRNPDYADYSELGGNCNNFASQCLYAGGIPMDHEGYGAAQWKWYSDYPNTSQAAFGRSSSWSGVEQFYEYCVSNTGFGLVSIADAPFCTGEPGDLIQFAMGGEYRHTAVISAVLTDENGNVIDYLINSNTFDQRDYPASAYIYAEKRLIRICGWNNA